MNMSATTDLLSSLDLDGKFKNTNLKFILKAHLIRGTKEVFQHKWTTCMDKPQRIIPHILNSIGVLTTSVVCIILANDVNVTAGQSSVLFKSWEKTI